MYRVTMTYHECSADVVHLPTLAAACNKLGELYAYYAGYDNRQGWITYFCDRCLRGTVLRCKVPQRHTESAQHDDRCYRRCPTCKGHYETPVED